MTEAQPNDELRRAEDLQTKFMGWLKAIHRLTYTAYGANGKFGGNLDSETPLAKGAASDLADKVLREFSSNYDQLPEGFHLKIGLTPGRYHELVGDSDTQLMCSTEDTKVGPSYWISFGRRVDPSELQEGKSAFNITGVGTNDPEQPRSRFDLRIVNKGGYNNLGPSIYPQDILAIKIDPNPLPSLIE